MHLKELCSLVNSGSLTCSEVMDLLMNQPTKPVQTNNVWRVESHAHMHTQEGFALGSKGFGGTADEFTHKVVHWESPTHLYPEDKSGTYNDSRLVVASGQSGKSSHKNVMQSVDRLAPDKSYVNRTGLGELLAVTETTYIVFKYEAKGTAPKPEEYKSLSDIAKLKVGKDTGEYLCKSASETNTIRVQEKTKTLIPSVKASSAHSMFADAESMVMHLTAALLSDAGLVVLNYMLNYMKPGENKTVGLFSNNAALAVAKADSNYKNMMLERRLEVDQSKSRDSKTGQYPSTGKILTAESDVDHVEVILGYRSTGELNVITCYPSNKPTGSTIGTATGPTEDIVEFKVGTHTKVIQKSALPKLKW